MSVYKLPNLFPFVKYFLNPHFFPSEIIVIAPSRWRLRGVIPSAENLLLSSEGREGTITHWGLTSFKKELVNSPGLAAPMTLLSMSIGC